MPEGENFWNPYRWVPVSKEKKVTHEKPAYRHRWQGLSGRLDCTLEALTPFLIGSSKEPGRFIRSGRTNQPFIPGTSLKGLIRSLAELIGNAAIPFPNGRADPGHKLEKAADGKGVDWRLDIAARMFGYLNRGQVFAGLVRFTDGVIQDNKVKEIGPFKIVVGKPEPDKHKPFYPDEWRRKFYHHHVGASKLVPAPSSITQTRTVHPLPPGTRFTFQVHFENLREEELNLLLYCLVLEENVTVKLSKEALGPNAQEDLELTGPLRHKFGGCKPQGGGSVKITIDKMALYADRANRYRGQAAPPRILEGEELRAELNRRTQPIADRDDETMRHLRAMLIYSSDDPRRPIEYPSYDWFKDSTKSSKPLKPTL
jgi:CRISPR/Cas system CSM-associated protein Csm3 (group 7 of RAMP superfamily)